MKIQNLKVSFKDIKVYEDFSIDLDNKKITCILGPSGCGKTYMVQQIGELLGIDAFGLPGVG